MKPKIKVSGDMQTENCFTTGNGIAYFRPKLDSLGMEPILNVEAHVIAIRKEGASVPVGEYPQLMMHPGTPTLAALKYKVPGFIDVIKTDPHGRQPMLALAWPYASVDSWIVASEDTYEIDITISSTSAPRKILHSYSNGEVIRLPRHSVFATPISSRRRNAQCGGRA